MAYYDEDQVFDGEAIRDTSNHTSAVSMSGEYLAKTIFIMNGLNQQVTLQLQGARDSVWLNVGSSFNVSASTNIYQTVSDYFPQYRMIASCASSPSSGDLDVWIIKAR
jgi:hypothetical protein